MKRILWTQQETEKLIKLVKQLQFTDVQKWQIVSKMLFVQFNISKSPHQCQKRWQQCHSSNSKKDKQTSNELSKLFNLHMEMGCDWKQLSNHLKANTQIDVKSKFYQSVRKGLRKIYKFYRRAEGAQYLSRINFMDISQFLIKLDEKEKRIVYDLIEWFCLPNRLQVSRKKLTTQQTILTKLIVEQLIQAHSCVQSRKKYKNELSAFQNNEFSKLNKNLKGYQYLHDRIQQTKIQKCINMTQKGQIIDEEEQGDDMKLFCEQNQNSQLSFYKNERQLENQFQIFQEEQQQGEQQVNLLNLGGLNRSNQITTKNEEKICHQILKQSQIFSCILDLKKSKQKIGKDSPIKMSKEREQKNEKDQQSCDLKRVLLSELCQNEIEEIGFELGLKQSPLFESFNLMDDQDCEHEI